MGLRRRRSDEDVEERGLGLGRGSSIRGRRKSSSTLGDDVSMKVRLRLERESAFEGEVVVGQRDGRLLGQLELLVDLSHNQLERIDVCTSHQL